MDSVFGFVLFSALIALSSVAVLALVVLRPSAAKPLRGAAWVLLIVSGGALLASFFFVPLIQDVGDGAIVIGPALVALAACSSTLRRTRAIDRAAKG